MQRLRFGGSQTTICRLNLLCSLLHLPWCTVLLPMMVVFHIVEEQHRSLKFQHQEHQYVPHCWGTRTNCLHSVRLLPCIPWISFPVFTFTISAQHMRKTDGSLMNMHSFLISLRLSLLAEGCTAIILFVLKVPQTASKYWLELDTRRNVGWPCWCLSHHLA